MELSRPVRRGYGQSVSAGVLNAFLGIGNNVIMVWEGQTSMEAGGQRADKRTRFEYEGDIFLKTSGRRGRHRTWSPSRR